LFLVKEIMNMKKLNVALAIFVAAVMAGKAETNTVYSDTVGYQAKSIGAGSLSVISAPFTDAVVTGTISAATSSSVTFGGVSNLGSLVNSTDPLYIEVSSGSLEGERYDIVLTSITSATDTLNISTASSNNTSTFPGATLVGASVALRKHTTLNSLKSMFSPGLKTGTATTGDLVYVFTSGAWAPYYLDTSSIWKKSGSLSSQNYVVIPPSSAVMLKRVDTTATVFTQTGSVRKNKFAKNYKAGLGVYAPGFPIAYSPNSLGATTAGGWSNGDIIYVMTSGAFVPYTFNSTAGSWKRTGNLSDFKASELLTSDSGILVKKANSANVSETSPVATN